MINLVATRHEFDKGGRKIATWAKARGLDPIRVRTGLSGVVKLNDVEIEALREDGLLVETDERKAA